MTRLSVKLVVAVLTLTLGVGVSSLRHRWHQNRLSTSNEVGPRRTYERESHYDAAKGSLCMSPRRSM